MTDEFDIVIAGGGIAGLTAGMYAARLGRQTLILTGTVPGGHLLSIEKIEGMPGFPDGISGYELCPMVQEAAMAEGAQVAATELQGIEADEDKYLIKTGMANYQARAVILATGSSLKELGVPGEAALRGKGVSHCASCDGPMLRDQAVVVVGGGDSALQEALTLANFASAVNILQWDNELTAQASYRHRVEQHERINVQLNTVVEEILGEHGVESVRVRDLLADSVREIDTKAVFIYIGMQPNTELLAKLITLDDSGYIPVDDSMRTETRGIFAAGILRANTSGQAVGAAGDGATAALAADRFLADGV